MRRRLTLCALHLLSVAAFSTPTTAQVYQGRELVKAELLADTSAIAPGKTFTAGLLLRMQPGWHTYWRYAGDAGIPTELKWQLPGGWSAAELRWPIPLKLTEPGDIQIYGYHDEVLLLQQITPPANLSSSSVELTAQANWLVCERICIPGSAELKLTLPVGQNAVAANAELFSRWRGRLPQAWPAEAQAKWSRAGSDLLLTLSGAKAGAATDFFPLPEGNPVVGHPKREQNDSSVTFRVPVEGGSRVNSLGGLVVFGQENGDSRTAWTMANEVPATGRNSGPIASASTTTGLAKFLLFGFIGGFILNLMPCVLPVISLKIFGFVQHAGQSRRRIFRSGLAFVAGIFACFLGLAVVLIALKAAGREITWALQFTNPFFVIAMSALVLVFALNLFGVFEISLPQWLARGAVGASAREGDAGSFFQGAFATVLATPCTAPFLGAALGFAFTQSALVIFAMFVAIAAGMSAPYLLLAAQPAWLRLLPKPGPWMIHVKQLMGFLLLATLVFLLAVLGAERGAEAVTWTCAFLLALSVACWLKGTFATPLASLRTRAVVVALMLAIVVASGWYFIGEKFPVTAERSVQTSGNGDWQPFTPERLSAELDAGRSVFVDFTAAWCLSCKFNEATVLESSAVRDAFHRRGVVKLKADWTNADPTITKILKQFGRPGVPLYVLYPAGNSRDPIVFPELLTRNMVLEKLETITPTVASQ